MKHIKINSLFQFLEEIRNINVHGAFKNFIYRGQSNKKWFLESGVHRRIRIANERNIKRIYDEHSIFESVEKSEIADYLKTKLIEARKRITSTELSELQQGNDVDMLVEMQHYGGATSLLDFTNNSLVALYFASATNPDVDGQVYCIDKIDDRRVTTEFDEKKHLEDLFPLSDKKVYLYSPKHNNRRILKQDSVFLFNELGLIEEKDIVECTFIIEAACKGEILQDLEDVAGITEESIYPDFLGYLLANSASKPYSKPSAEDYFERAKTYQSEKKYYEAIKYFKLSIKEDPNKFSAHLDLSRCFSRLGKYLEARQYCSTAENLNPNSCLVWIESGVLYTLMHKIHNAKASFEKARKLKSTKRENDLYNYNLAYLHLCIGETEIARKEFEQLLDVNQPFDPALNIAHSYLLENKMEDAEKFYKIAFDNSPKEDNLSYKYTFREAFELDYKAAKMELKEIDHSIIDEYVKKFSSFM